MVEIYVGATQNQLTKMGGWGVVLIDEGGRPKRYRGFEGSATQPEMILRAAIEGLSKTVQGCEAKILSNNQYLILGIEDSRQRREKRDLWEQLDEVASRRHVQAEYVAKHKWLDEARLLAKEAAGSQSHD